MRRTRMRHVNPSGLVVAGYDCPTSGQITSSSIPFDGRYYLTVFGGGADTQGVACPGLGIADGTWYYAADSDRFGCGTKIRISNPANGTSVIAQVIDSGPNICVEQAGGMPVIDASPLVSQYLFGQNSSGWEDRRLVTADVVDPSTPLGPTGYVSGLDLVLTYLSIAAIVGGVGYAAYEGWRRFA